MLPTATIVVLLLSTIQAVPLTKRDSSYVDEPMISSTEAPLTEGLLDAQAEEAASTVEQTAPSEQPYVESSGYRIKRRSSYGDEVIIPDVTLGAAVYAPIEEASASVEQPSLPASRPYIESSGYRRKRSNKCNNRSIIPQGVLAKRSVYEILQHPPAPVIQPAALPVEVNR